MEYDVKRGEIKLGKKLLNKLDKFILDFIKILEKYTEYVIVSGYVSILLGRSRATEDIDLLIPKINKENLSAMWEELYEHHFECINTSKPEEAFEMLKEHAIRFFKDIPVPNIEFKIIKSDLDKHSFNSRLKVILEQGVLFISPLEMQIAYKLFLGSEKDLEDAKHLYDLFKEKLNKEELLSLISELKVKDKFDIINKKNEDRFRRT